MNKAVLVFVKNKDLVLKLIRNGIPIRDSFVQASPLSAPSTRTTVSTVAKEIKWMV